MSDEELKNQLSDVLSELKKLTNSMGGGGVGAPQQSNRVNQSDKEVLSWLKKEVESTGKAFSETARKQKDVFDRILKQVQEGGERAFRSLHAHEQQILRDEAAARSRTKDTVEAHEKLIKSTNNVSDVQRYLRENIYNVSRTLQTFRDTLLDGQNNLKKYSSTLSSGFDFVTKSIENFGELKDVGTAAKVAIAGLNSTIKTFGFLGTQSLEYGDAILKNKDQLADMGAIGEHTSQQLMKMAEDAQYTSKTLEGWTKATRSLNTSIMSLGRNVNEGVASFAKISKISEDELANYRAMGYSQEQVTQGQADYVALLAKSGTIITDRDIREGKIQKASKEYLVTLAELSNYTGKQRDEVKKSVEQAQSIMQFQLRMRSITRETGRLEEDIKSGKLTGEDAAAAKERIEFLKRQEAGFKKAINEAMLIGGPERAALVARAIGTRGMTTSAEQAMQLRDVMPLLRQVEAGKEIEGGATAQALRATLERQEKSFGTAIAVSDEFAKLLGFNSDVLKMLTERQNIDERAAAREAKTTATAAGRGDTSAKTLDTAEKIRDDFFRMQLQVQATLDTMSDITLPKIEKATNELAKVFEAMLPTVRSFAKENPNTALGLTGLAGGLAGALGGFLGSKWLAGKLSDKIFGGAGGAGAAGGANAGAGGATRPPTTGGFVEKSAAEIKAMKPSERMAYMQARAAANAAQTAASGTAAASTATTATTAATSAATGTSRVLGLAKGALRLLSKAAVPLTVATTGYDAYKGFTADEDASFGTKLKNAGSSVLSGLTFGLLGSSPEEIKQRAEEQKLATDNSTTATEKLEKTSDTLKGSIDALRRSIDNLNSTMGGRVSGGTTGTPFTGNKKEFTDRLYNSLLAEAKRQGLPNPEVIAQLGTAQSALETGYGKSLAGGNNYFGIKDFSKGGGNTQSTKEFIDGKWVTINDKFRRYGSMEESSQDYIRFLMQNPRYAKVLQAGSREDAARLIRESGYATDPEYSSKLLSIMGKMSPSNVVEPQGRRLNSPTPDVVARMQRPPDVGVPGVPATTQRAAVADAVTVREAEATGVYLTTMTRVLSSIDNRMSTLNNIQERMLHALA